jgi:hypothetical protein
MDGICVSGNGEEYHYNRLTSKEVTSQTMKEEMIEGSFKKIGVERHAMKRLSKK